MAGTGVYGLRLRVRPEPDLLELVPRYLARREADVEALEEAVTLQDHATVHRIGHSMKGSGGGYGFQGITDIGLRLEDAGREADLAAARLAIEDLGDYLRNVEILHD